MLNYLCAKVTLIFSNKVKTMSNASYALAALGKMHALNSTHIIWRATLIHVLMRLSEALNIKYHHVLGSFWSCQLIYCIRSLSEISLIMYHCAQMLAVKLLSVWAERKQVSCYNETGRIPQRCFSHKVCD